MLGNNTDINNKSNHILSSVDGIELDEIRTYKVIIMRNIDYACLIERYTFDKELLAGILDIIHEAVVSKKDYIVISSDSYPTELVCSKFLKLNFCYIEYVLGCMKSNTTKVKNIKKYLMASLFNAPSTMSSYYQAEVNHDLPQYAKAR